MTDRFSLRFASGEREGETVPLPAPRATIGRRPGNTVQVQDGSISGSHAEFVVDGGGVTVRDLGSTNGTRVGGQKITERRLAHGDRVSFGSVEAVFVDAELMGDFVEPRRALGDDDDEGVERVSAELLARSGKRSKTGLLAGVVVLLAAGGGAAWFLLGGEGGARRHVEPPLVVDGNLLGGGDFEGDALAEGWQVEELGAADFAQRADARATGRDGLRSTLEPGEQARVFGPLVTVTPGRGLVLAASLRASGGALGRVGLELLPDGGSEGERPAGTTAWSAPVAEATQHQRYEVEVPVPPGARRARVVIEAFTAGEGGTVDVDDVSLVAGGACAPTAKVAEFTLWTLGAPAQTATLYKISKPLVGDLGGAGATGRVLELGATPGAGRVELAAAGAQGLTLRVEPEALRQGLASLGAGGYQEHGPSFERAEATGLLLAQGKDLVALRFARPVTLSGRPEGAGVRVDVAGAAGCTVQLDFAADRDAAGERAHAARRAEQDGRLGACMTNWGALLDEEPFDAALVEEARATRARLEQTGLLELEEVERALERAQFFRLVDLYRQCRRDARAVGQRYAGSTVEAKAEELVARVEASLGELEADLDADEIARLRAIRRALAASEATRLAAAVHDYLATEYGVED